MSEKAEMTKTELLERIDETWTALQATLEQLDEAQLSQQKDAEGWAIKDHIVHLAAWERSVVFLLQSRPRYAGLGVDEALYLSGNEDAINAAVYERFADLPAGEALAQLGDVHGQMMTLLQPLSDADLSRSYREYLPDEAAENDGPPVMGTIYGNTAYHFAEHLEWIQALAGGQTAASETR